MKLDAFLPLITYPEPMGDAVAANAVAVAVAIGAELHATALTLKVPPVASPLSRALLDLPSMVREAEGLSAERGAHLLDQVAKAATEAGV